MQFENLIIEDSFGDKLDFGDLNGSGPGAGEAICAQISPRDNPDTFACVEMNHNDILRAEAYFKAAGDQIRAARAGEG